MKTLKIIIIILLLSINCNTNASLQTTPEKEKEYLKSAETLVTEIYKSVSFKTGELPNWDKVREMFNEKAVVVLRTSRTATSQFDVKGFIDDFINFIEKSPAKEKGFIERILKMKSVIIGDIAHILVLYDAQISGSANPPQQGIDSWQLAKKDDRWQIISVVNEVITKDVPVPDELK